MARFTDLDPYVRQHIFLLSIPTSTDQDTFPPLLILRLVNRLFSLDIPAVAKIRAREIRAQLAALEPGLLALNYAFARDIIALGESGQRPPRGGYWTWGRLEEQRELWRRQGRLLRERRRVLALVAVMEARIGR